MYKAVIFQHRLLHYRVRLFELLRARCLENSIELHIIHGQPTKQEKARNDVGYLEWADSVENWSVSVMSRDLVWLPFPLHLRDADLVVLMQENRQLSNYPILLSRFWSNRKLAYWGHGSNFQSSAPRGLRECWKKLLLTKVDWWFAYTQLTFALVENSGFPTNQITCLNNSIDTASFKLELESVTDIDLAAARDGLGILPGAPVGIFCGSLYQDKKLDFLVAAGDRIYKEATDFHCIVLGDGPSMASMLSAAKTRPWLHLMGVTKGAKKALYFRIADFMLNPGLVGLHIVDAFCAGLVMTTTVGARHSPEIAYLRQDINGLMTGDSVDEYARIVVNLIRDKEALRQIKAAALKDSEVYTLDNMVDQFVDGMRKCIAN